MKIGYFISDIREYGEFKRCFSIAKNIAKMGHQVTIVCGSTQSSLIIKTEMRENVRIIKLPYLHPFSLENRFSKTGKVRVQPQEYLGQFLQGIISLLMSLFYDFDVVHCFSFSLPLAATAAFSSKIIKRCRLVLDWVDIRGEDGIGQSYNKIIHLLLTILEEKIITLADALTVTSSFLAVHAVRLGANDIFHIPTGSNTDLIKPISKEYARTQLGYETNLKFVVYEGGSSTTEDVILYLLKSFRIASKRNPDLRLIIIGCTITKPIYMMADELNIKTTVYFINRQPQERIYLFLGAADLLVLPLLDNAVYKAGWPGRFGDLICAARPILVSEVGDIPQVVQKERIGFTAKPSDIEDFAMKIEKIVNCREFDKSLEAKTSKLAEKYAWDNIAQKVMLIYENKLQSDWNGRKLNLF